MENGQIKRYRVNAENDQTGEIVQFIVRDTEYKNAWQNARADCRFGRTVERFSAANGGATGEQFDLAAGQFIVRSVKSMEKRAAKIVEPSYSELIAWFDRDDTANPSKTALKQLADARSAILAERVTADASNDETTDA